MINFNIYKKEAWIENGWIDGQMHAKSNILKCYSKILMVNDRCYYKCLLPLQNV